MYTAIFFFFESLKCGEIDRSFRGSLVVEICMLLIYNLYYIILDVAIFVIWYVPF